MAADKSFPSVDRETERQIHDEHVTGQPVKDKQFGKDVVSHTYAYEVGTDAVEASSTTTIVNATAHVAKRGDILRFTSGALNNTEVGVLRVETDSIELSAILESAPATSDTFQILRYRTPATDEFGSANVNITAANIAIDLDGSSTNVAKDTSTPSNTVAVPVEIVSASGSEVTITAGDINIQSTHLGASHDSMRIGDGTEQLEITAAGEAGSFDATAHTKLDSLLTEMQLKADLSETQPVSAASLPLPAGASTEATLASILSELEGKADLAETQPVSVASLPLPSGAATEVTSAALLTELQLKADLSETQPVSAASLPLPSGASTEATLQKLEDRLSGALIPEAFDYIALTYVAAGDGAGEIETATYKTGGAAGTTVGTLTLAYDASDRISSVTKA